MSMLAEGPPPLREKTAPFLGRGVVDFRFGKPAIVSQRRETRPIWGATAARDRAAFDEAVKGR